MSSSFVTSASTIFNFCGNPIFRAKVFFFNKPIFNAFCVAVLCVLQAVQSLEISST